MKRLLPAVLLCVSVAGVAAERSAYKSMTPYTILYPGVVGHSQFILSSSDLPGRGLLSPQLQSIKWRTTAFPNSTGEKVEICYVRPGSRTHTDCIDISKNSSGTVTEFNSFRFDVGSSVVIRHSATGGKNNSKPAGQDSVIYTYSY
ncbi:MAG: hypothetical protein JWR17_78 [Pseudomonas sp.]|jgi:hypothetical protein|nr:hypothetical protein [Pseudomonas sp.]